MATSAGRVWSAFVTQGFCFLFDLLTFVAVHVCMVMRVLLLALLLLVLHAASLAVRPKLTAFSPGGNFPPPAREPTPAPPGPRDVVVELYDISTPELAASLSFLAGRKAYWFPKLTVTVGNRVWSYDGEIERTVAAIVANAAGGPPLRTFNLGACCMSDAEVDALLASMGESDYSPEEYDFFFRNCNHFVDDLSQRLVGDAPGCGVDREFMEQRVLGESESILSNMWGPQAALTRQVTYQVQKIIVRAWRKEWKRALAEYEEKASLAK
jgi:hypothetical protein